MFLQCSEEIAANVTCRQLWSRALSYSAKRRLLRSADTRKCISLRVHTASWACCAPVERQQLLGRKHWIACAVDQTDGVRRACKLASNAAAPVDWAGQEFDTDLTQLQTADEQAGPHHRPAGSEAPLSHAPYQNHCGGSDTTCTDLGVRESNGPGA
jgi:hypothetical protein